MTALQPVAGATGAAGTSLMQNVRDLSGTPDAVTDWGAIINTAIAAGTKAFFFPHKVGTTTPTSYPVTTTIDLDRQSGISFIGEAGWGGHATGTTGGDRMVKLIWKGGAGTGQLLRFDNTDAFTASNMSLCYDNVAYNGTLIKLFNTHGNNSGDALFDRCFIGATGSTMVNAAFLVDLNSIAVGFKFQYCLFQGANYHIKGKATDTNGNCDDDSFLYCLFTSATTAFFCNMGNFMVVEGCVFAFGGAGGTRSQSVIDSDHSAVAISSHFSFQKNRMWDPLDAAHVYFEQRVKNPWSATFADNWFYQFDGKHWNLNGPGKVVIENNNIDRLFNGVTTATPVIDAGSSATALKTALVIRNNHLGVIDSTKWTWITNLTGHGLVVVDNNETSTVQASRQITKFSHEYVAYASTNALTITNPNANISNINVRVGEDGGGIM
jgi:hypothetical protein